MRVQVYPNTFFLEGLCKLKMDHVSTSLQNMNTKSEAGLKKYIG